MNVEISEKRTDFFSQPVKLWVEKNRRWETFYTEMNHTCNACGRWLACYHDCPEWDESWTMTKKEIEKWNLIVFTNWERTWKMECERENKPYIPRFQDEIDRINKEIMVE